MTEALAVATDGVLDYDFHATILHMLGIDHTKLTDRHAGRDDRLTGVGGCVVRDLPAEFPLENRSPMTVGFVMECAIATWLMTGALLAYGEDKSPIPMREQPPAGTKVAIDGTRWLINGKPTNVGTPCEGLLMNVRMVNATFEDLRKPEFDAEKNTAGFLAKIPDYAAQGVNAFTLNLQGGMPGYEGAAQLGIRAGRLAAGGISQTHRTGDSCLR